MDKKKSTPEVAPLPVQVPVVGIGASAGGLRAFEAFFAGFAGNCTTGLAFVLVQHLAPDHPSLLCEIVGRFTKMKVIEVTDGIAVEPDCVYIIPPSYDLALLGGTLQLLEPVAPLTPRHPIDYFFKSLAQDLGKYAVAIVLSGTGRDGTLGVQEVKKTGGMVLAQEPESCEYDPMPTSAMDTGIVDFVLLPEQMLQFILDFQSLGFTSQVQTTPAPQPQDEQTLKKIFVLLRSQTGHDFSQYKSNTISRRIHRRMTLHQLITHQHYLQFLQKNPDEVRALFQDFLIGVTSFFRDPQAFADLENLVIPELFAGKHAGSVIRVWVPGCSTGEEAYSIAILLQERMETIGHSFIIQIFATDIDSQAITAARAGIFSLAIAADVSPHRLERFFKLQVPKNSSKPPTYVIQKGIRDMLVFSEQDLIKDPPFSKLDLISCRNLMIYFDGNLQKKLFPLFHFALNPNGILFLGTSESVGDFNDHYVVIDRKSKLFRRKEAAGDPLRWGITNFIQPISGLDASLNPHQVSPFPSKLPLREITEKTLLGLPSPMAALVNAQGDIFYLHGRTGMFLEPAMGVTGVNNIIRMAREGLHFEITTGLHKVVQGQANWSSHGLRVKTNGHYSLVNMTITTVDTGSTSDPLFLIVLQELGPAPDLLEASLNPHTSQIQDQEMIVQLRQELRAKDEYIQSTHEQLESANEELKSSNEEMQSVNEELQSTNEELETSKEELQSVNEELITINGEIQTKVLDLSRVNNDMINLLAGTGIATVFLDLDLSILRYTPSATEVIHLITADIGRPLAHVVPNLLEYSDLVQDAKGVLNTLIPKTIEVQSLDHKWYSLHIIPYRTLENVISGVVITFVDITEKIHAERALAGANDLLRLAIVVRDSSDAITVQDLTGKTIAWNSGAQKLYGWTEAQALGMNVRDRIPEPLRAKALESLILLSQSEVLEPYRTQRLRIDNSVVNVSVISTALVDEIGQMYAVATTERHIKETA